MRLHELFESPFAVPGVNYVLNDPQDHPAAGQGGANTAATANDAVRTNSDQQPQTQTNAFGANGGMSTAGGSPQNANTNPVSNAAVTQQISKGAPITMPLGPSKQPTQMKITNVTNDTSNSSGKMVTIKNMQQQNQPEQTYPIDQLEKLISQKNQNQGQ